MLIGVFAKTFLEADGTFLSILTARVTLYPLTVVGGPSHTSSVSSETKLTQVVTAILSYW